MTDLNWMPGWMTISSATDVPVEQKEIDMVRIKTPGLIKRDCIWLAPLFRKLEAAAMDGTQFIQRNTEVSVRLFSA